MLDDIISTNEERMKKTVASLKDGFAKSPLNQVANISIPEARLVVIQPWDNGLITEIEKSDSFFRVIVKPVE